ncbi:MAG: nitroreductase family protein [Acidimicrobiales bacterium]
MDFRDVVRKRRMVRAFSPEPVPQEVLDRVLDAGRRAPSAGNSQGWAFVVLAGPDETARYWDVTFPPARRSGFKWQTMFDAPVLVIPLASAQPYLERYREPDKLATGLGAGPDAWPVPYWTVDTSFAAMLMLLAAVDEGLGAVFFGIFSNERALLDALEVPAGWQPIGTIALGWPEADEPGTSARRRRRPFAEVVHRGRW